MLQLRYSLCGRTEQDAHDRNAHADCDTPHDEKGDPFSGVTQFAVGVVSS